MNDLGVRLRELREAQGLLLRQVAAQIDVDTALMSKLERGERKPQREHILKLAGVLKANEKELLTLWLAERVTEILENEPLAEEALRIAEKKIKN